MFTVLRKKETLFSLLLALYFAYLLVSRLVYLDRDLPDLPTASSTTFETEEKQTAYSARSLALFNDWRTGGENYESIISSPLPNIISYFGFLLMGVSLFSLRFPYALCSVAAIFIFYKVLKKETSSAFAFLGILLFGSASAVTFINRTATAENIFIPLMGLALYFYQRYAEDGKGRSIFLFGFFATFTLSVKYSGMFFLLPAVLAVMGTAFSQKKTWPEFFKFGAAFMAGSLCGLTLTVVALIGGRESTGMGMMTEVCGRQLDSLIHNNNLHFFNVDLSGQDLAETFRFFFIVNFPYLFLSAILGLFIMIFYRLRDLSRTDFFVLLWFVLGSSIIAFRTQIGFKGFVFLFLPITYVALKGGYEMWRGLNESKGPSVVRENGLKGPGRELLRVMGVLIPYILFLIMIPWLTKFFLVPYGRHREAEMVGVVLVSAFALLPICLAIENFIATKNFLQAVFCLKKWFVGCCFSVFVTASVLSIATNELFNIKTLFNPQARTFQSFESSRDLGRILKPGTPVIGTETALKYLGFENQCKFTFVHDATVNYSLSMDVDHVIRRRDVRYFCLGTIPQLTPEFVTNLKKIYSAYPQARLIKDYSVGSLHFILGDKYPLVPEGAPS